MVFSVAFRRFDVLDDESEIVHTRNHLTKITKNVPSQKSSDSDYNHKLKTDDQDQYVGFFPIKRAFSSSRSHHPTREHLARA